MSLGILRGVRYPFDTRGYLSNSLRSGRTMPTIPEPIAKLQCPRCQSRLEVFETTSGGRTVAVTTLGPTVERSAIALETFQAPAEGPRLKCPACANLFDPTGGYRAIPPMRRPASG
jgi:hypothetical protein